MAEFNRRKKKVCMMCTGKTVDYKDPESLRRYVNEKGKMTVAAANFSLFTLHFSLLFRTFALDFQKLYIVNCQIVNQRDEYFL